jgi:hypothetical protein
MLKIKNLAKKTFLDFKEFMKFLFLVVYLISANAFAQKASMGQIFRTVTTAGTPLQVSTTGLFVRSACFQCSSANNGTTCFIGTSALGAASGQGVALLKPTATVSGTPFCIGDLNNSSYPKVDLMHVWVNADTSADRVNIFYIE